MLETVPEKDPQAASAKAGAELARGALFNTIAVMASNLRGIFTFLIARILGGPALGTFAVAWGTTDLLSKIGTFGLDNGTIAFVARSQSEGNVQRSRRILHSSVRWGLLISLITAVLGILGLQWFGERLGQPPELVRASSFMLLALPGVALYRISNGVSRGMKVMDHDIYTRGLTEALGTTAVFLIAVAIGLREFAPVVAAIAGTGASGIVAYFLARGLFRGLGTSNDTSAVSRPLLEFSAPIALYSLMNIFIMRLDMILLQFYIDRAPGVTVGTVGIYAAALELSGGLRKVRQAFDPIFTPVAASHAATGDLETTQLMFAALARWLLAIVLPILGLFLLVGTEVLGLYGDEFRMGWTWLLLLGLASGLNAFVGLAETLILVHHPRLNLINSTITIVIAFISSLMLIPRWGATGAAMGMVIPYSIQGLLRHFELRHFYGWRWPWRALLRPVLASCCALVPVWLVRGWLPGFLGAVVVALLYLGLYAGIWLRLGLDVQDRAILAELRRKRKPAAG